MTARFEWAAGRSLLALLFIAGTVQKGWDPSAAKTLLAMYALHGWLVWPALVFNAGAAICLIANIYLRPVARALALYCVTTSLFHFVPSDPWQMSILVKNWALAGGFLILSASADAEGREDAR